MASFTLEALTQLLGKQDTTLLSAIPFRKWSFEKSIEKDLTPPITDYVCTENGMDFVCDEDGTVSAIFLYFDEVRRFSGNIIELPSTKRQSEVIKLLGIPTQRGDKSYDPILGAYGPWDRFVRPPNIIQIEYHVNDDSIKKITLMKSTE